MHDRPNWYYDHPPACTCVSCSRSRAGRRQQSRPENQSTGQATKRGGRSGMRVLAFLIVIAVIAGLGGMAYWRGMLPFEIQLTPKQPASANVPLVAPVIHAPTETPVAAQITPTVQTIKAVVQPTAPAASPGPVDAPTPTSVPTQAAAPTPTSVPTPTTTIANDSPPPTPTQTAAPVPSPTPLPAPQVPDPTPASIMAEVTTVSFVGIGYTLNLQIDDIPNGKSHEQVRLVVTHRDGTVQEEITQFMQIRNGDYTGAVTVDREWIENSDVEWVRDNIAIEVLPERASNSSRAAAQSPEATRTPILSPTKTPRPTRTPMPMPSEPPPTAAATQEGLCDPKCDWDFVPLTSGVKWLQRPTVSAQGILSLSVQVGDGNDLILPGSTNGGASNIALTNGGMKLYGSIIPPASGSWSWTPRTGQSIADVYSFRDGILNVSARISAKIATQTNLTLCLWSGGTDAQSKVLDCVPVAQP